MEPSLCPICSTRLEPRAVSPCFDCGHAPSELEECAQGAHRYYVYAIWGQEIVLCDFCDADFGSFYPDYFGLPAGPRQRYPLELVRRAEAPAVSRDLYCPHCKHRLAFLEFVARARAHNAGSSSR